jgi:glyoxylase-like metal-dependent hydrolase (beta-lactamase superfamily II)/ferredoxin
MASEARRLDSNVAGDLYVDDSCIDCGACRWIAPATFDAHAGYARVQRQPSTAKGMKRALQALVSCPTGSIGTEAKHPLGPITSSFPRLILPAVYHCGFHSDKSFGAASYLIVRDGGNVLVDSPRFNRGLLRRIEELGPVRWMFLTHADDVAEHARFAKELGCERVLHADDVRAGTRVVETQLRGEEPIELADDLLVIPTAGHTRGSACLLFRDDVLFSGDHVAFSRALDHVYAFSGACWYDWGVQIRSMERLATHDLEHILPGHGAPCSFESSEMRRQIQHCVAWMREQA